MELKAFKKYQNRKTKRAERIDYICKETGWNKSKVDQELKKLLNLESVLLIM